MHLELVAVIVEDYDSAGEYRRLVDAGVEFVTCVGLIVLQPEPR
ncbi:hypothetical protein FB390_2739 [Nocardia bhagyanarayanae]|uniref:Uncharacterized protein n=1 Tax=Nocardia bhagyanarayanae TaxID=1215925 RepID=A0A543FB89_9NOCA|nr:hypothetical protein FB390_2739 [Nocardia bhagyanarayanae]